MTCIEFQSAQLKHFCIAATTSVAAFFLFMPDAWATPHKVTSKEVALVKNLSPNVRVRMVVAQTQIIVNGHFKLSSGRLRYASLLIRRQGDAWLTRVLGAPELKSENSESSANASSKLKDSDLRPIRRQFLVLEGQDLSIGDLKLPDRVQVVRNQIAGTLDVVATLDLESYLSGVLPSEMPKSWPIEAVKAQAVASRTYVFRRMLERRSLHFDVENTVFDQVFRMQEPHRDPTSDDPIQKVLKQTTGEVLLDSAGKLVTTFYHSQCGGKTEASRAVWGLGRLKPVQDSHCVSETKPWEFQVDKTALSRMIRQALNLTNPGELVHLSVGQRTTSGRVDHFVARFNNQEAHRIRGDQLRSILGYGKLKSTKLELSSNGEEWTFSGRGFGHGVGMCQWGAKAMATKDHSYDQILTHYYPGSAVRRL